MRTALLALAALLVASQGVAGSIGIYADPGATQCNLSIAQGQSAVVYVVGRTSSSDPFGGYVNEGECRIVGVPPTWLATAIADPALTAFFGDPLGDGAIFGLGAVRAGLIPIFTIALTATTEVQNLEFQVTRHVNPSPPFGYPTTCPWFLYVCGEACDITGTCVDGVSLVVNGACTTSVEGTTWSRMRGLYR